MKTGLFGGTFDPIHNGHIKVAQAAKNSLGLDRVIFIPAGAPPHKTDKKVSGKEHRLSMTRLAAEAVGAEVSDWEIRQDKKSYSVDLVRHFKETLPDDELFFIIGADSFRDLPLWYQYRELLSMCTFLVVSRPDVPKETLLSKYVGDEAAPRVFFLDDILVDISSTEIRKTVADGGEIERLVPPGVLTYIKTHKLYTNGG